MKVLFSLLSSAYLRTFESAVRLLAERGHEVGLVTHERTGWAGSDGLARRLCEEYPGVSHHQPPECHDRRATTRARVRACADYVQFLDGRYNRTYRARAEARVPRQFRAVVDRSPLRGRLGRAVLGRGLPAAEGLLPPSPALVRFVQQHRPDVVLFTPYVGLSTVQPAYLAASRAARVPTAVCVGSWDHLTSKSAIRPTPDIVTVWNDTQRREAVDLHGIPEDRVVVTGAQCFDHWFEWRARPRGEFCRLVGLDPDRPFLLYTCFSPFKGGPNEAEFVRRWIELVRSSGNPRLERIGVLVRPHPKRIAQWRDVDLNGLDNVVLWPPEGSLVGEQDAKAGLFDSIHHSAGVVGINTSAMIEAGIVGRRVHTILLPEYWASQHGTLHFQYLMEVGGGLLHVARSFGEHIGQLADSVAVGGQARDRNRGFVESFIRPHGIDRAATPRFVDAIEKLGGGASAPSLRRCVAPERIRA